MRWELKNAIPQSALLAAFVLLRATTGSAHADLFPLHFRDALGFAVAAGALMIAAGGGIGGGALLVPICIIVLDFQPNNAVALSNVTIVGGAFANFLFNAHRRHPYCDKPLIDWDLIMVMEPTTIMGALLGSYINKIMPAWLTTTLLALLLTLLSYKLVIRGMATFVKESRDIAEARATIEEEAARIASETNGREHGSRQTSPSFAAWQAAHFRRATSMSASEVDFTEDNSTAAAAREHHRYNNRSHDDLILEPLLDGYDLTSNGVVTEHQDSAVAVSSDQLEHQFKLAKLQLSESRQLPVERIAVLFLLMLAVIAADSIKARLPCGSPAYWAISLSLVPLTLLTSAITAVVLVRKHNAKNAAGQIMPAGEVAWTPRHVVIYPAICSLAGLVAGMFGVGGGIVKGPLMLEMGVLPDVAAATSATMIMFTAASASAVYIGFGTVKYDYGAVLFAIGLVATFIGQSGASELMRRFERRSVIICCMAAFMLLSTVVMYGEAAVRTYAAFEHNTLWELGSICS